MKKMHCTLLFLFLIFGSGCCTVPDGNKKGSLVDAGEESVPDRGELTDREAENAFCAAFIIWKVENGLSGPVPVFSGTGREKARFRQGLTEAGAEVSESKRGAYLLEDESSSGKRIFTLREPSGKAVLVRSYRIRRKNHE